MHLRPALLALLVLAVPAVAQETAEDPDFEDGAPVEFGGLVQTQFNTSDRDAADPTNLALRRVRLSANARVSPLVSGRIQAELANAAVGGSAELNEAYVLFSVAPSVGVLVGKGGRPFGVIDATAAANLTPIERGARFRGAETVELYRTMEALAYAGRSVGVQVLGERGPIAYAAGYFSGSTGEEGNDADIRQVAGRVQLEAAGLRLGLAATNRAFARDDPPGLGPDGAAGADPSGETQRGSGVSFDVGVGEYGQPGLHGLVEVSYGTIDPFRDSDFVAAQGWLAYRLPTGGPVVALEPLFRASVADVDGPLGESQGLLLTPGVNVYAAQNTKLALNLDVFVPDADGASTLVAFRSQVQIEF